jgi:NitT/TauT family transport system ATP-binding protein
VLEHRERDARRDTVTGGEAVRFTQVSKEYMSQSGSTTLAVSEVTFSVGSGEFVSLVGPSGCGKTTLLRMCAGLTSPTSGSISFRDTGAPPPPGEFGIVFQQPALLPWKTIEENIALPGVILKTDNAARARGRKSDRVAELLELMRLPKIARMYPGELSGGMQQRVAIARALFHDPGLLLMDEPFGALDAITREELNLHFERVQAKARHAVLFITHSIEEAVLLSDRVIVMSRSPGRILVEVANDMPRPRGRQAVASDRFAELSRTLRGAMAADTLGDGALDA